MTSTDVCRAWVYIDANMLDMLDSGLANVSTALTQAQMWQHTLLVFSAVRPPSLPPAQNRLELKTVRSCDLSTVDLWLRGD